jgi:hypothetical protein
MARNPDKKPVMEVPSHGRGKLRRGGTNKGGTGRPKEVIRADLRKGLDKVLPLIAKGLKDGTIDAIRAAEFYAKYGIGTQQEVDKKDLREKSTTELWSIVNGEQESA